MEKGKIRTFLGKEYNVRIFNRMSNLVKYFTRLEKVIFYTFAAILVVTGITLLFKVNKNFLVEVPDYGGTLVEGIVGYPRFINPVLSTSDSDKDLTSLVYSGLLKTTSDGSIILDLADEYEISADGLTYKVTLKDNATFHDGTKVTADDVIFTIEKVQDPTLKSPRSGAWEGIRVQKVDDRTVIFTLSQSYSPFLQSLSLGILPKHIWKNISIEEFPFSQFNIKPIGSGPYKIDSQNYSGNGLPNEYKLKSFNKYALGKPYITSINIKSYSSERELTDSYKNGDIESIHSISPKNLPDLRVKNDDVIFSPLPRIFGVFFNQNIAQVFVNKEVREALEIATDKKEIINTILGGYGQIIDNPVPGETALNNETKNIEERVIQAKT
ncbi:MAG: ABC transporter substrate-binding protein, partial [Minisyncoccia bacterium]